MALEEPRKPSEPKAFKIIKKMYKYCLKTRSTEKQDLDLLLNYIEQLGGWPVLKENSWNESAFDWRGMNYKIGNKTAWINFFFKFNNPTNSENGSLLIDMAEPPLSHTREVLVDLTNKFKNKFFIQSYFDTMVAIAVYMGAKPKIARKDLRDALDFEMKLGKILLTNEQLHSDPKFYYKSMTVAELAGNYSFYPWKNSLNNQFSPNITFNDDTTVYLDNFFFIKNFENLIKTTSNRTIANYAIWYEIQKHSSFIDINKNVTQNSSSTNDEFTSQKICFDEVSGLFPLAIGALYTRKYFNQNLKEQINIIGENVYEQFSEMLNSSNIMDDETKEKAFLILANMTRKVTPPDELFDDSKLDEYYREFEVLEDGYLNNRLRALIFNEEISWAQSFSGDEIPETDWISFGKATHILVPLYKFLGNTIEIPGGMLQGIFFDNDRPDYINYGTIGSLIGHEVTHRFDDDSKYWDHEGNLDDWWTPLTKKRFDDKAKCLINQYGKYTVQRVNLKINGKITLSENIADNGGIRAAYFAYKKTLMEHQTVIEKKLPNLNYTLSQLFWISTANMWCEKSSKISSSFALATDVHSPQEFRVIGMLSNSQEFAVDSMGIQQLIRSSGNNHVTQIGSDTNFLLNENNVCTTTSCIESASTILKNMDPHVNPCDNFYRFACGGYLNSTDIPDESSYIDIWSLINDKVSEKLITSLEKAIKSNEPRAFKLAKNFYKLCMNTTAIEEQGLDSLYSYIEQFGGWPVLKGNNWNESSFDWKGMNYKIDGKNNTKRSIYLTDPLLGHDREYLVKGLDEERVQTYFSYIINIAVEMGADPQLAMEDLIESFGFETELAKITLSQEQTIANYAIWHEIQNYVPYLNDKLNNVKKDYYYTGHESRQEICLGSVKGLLPLAVGAIYTREHFNDDAKKHVDVIAKNVQDEFSEILKHSNWIDKKIKKLAVNKVNNMIRQIAYPDELFNDTKIDDYYKDFEFFDESYFNSCLSAKSFHKKISWKLIKKTVDKNDWSNFGSLTSNVNSYYSRSSNKILIPAGILHGMLFDDYRPKYLNYGGIGSIIGHEITHGFDIQGSQFDDNGKLANWLTPTISKIYHEKAQCFIDQYNNYTVSEVELKVNGINTQSENIADNGGVKAAYFAYKNWLLKNNIENKLPNLNYEPKQMFWISFANTWCSKYRLTNLKDSVNLDNHSPNEFRVVGPLSNIQEFSNDFNCPIGSPMNPLTKCSIW
ncbi:neprilysin-2-like [Aphidius gifuensis]|uniref:neprilysin-2-like n=1 Tax=Aphidius gifuensis TaxID=684658 RepID=UPI001CDD29DA|nr:neprilysin-2-like [Aphidius gifuensis]